MCKNYTWMRSLQCEWQENLRLSEHPTLPKKDLLIQRGPKSFSAKYSRQQQQQQRHNNLSAELEKSLAIKVQFRLENYLQTK